MTVRSFAELFQLSIPRTESQEKSISTLEEMEMQMIRKALDTCAGNLSAVAAQLGITRQTLYNKMKSSDYDSAASTSRCSILVQSLADGTFLYIVRVVRYTSIIQLVRSQSLFIGS